MFYNSFTSNDRRGTTGLAGVCSEKLRPHRQSGHAGTIAANTRQGNTRAKAKGAGSAGLLVWVLCYVACWIPFRSLAQTVPGNDSSRYVHDTRTYGIRYQRVWADTAFVFPRVGDTTVGTGQGHPSLFSTGLGPANLWWFDGFRNWPIASGGGVPLGTANGLQTDAGNAILGYSGATPNLYRSVLTKTGEFHTWGINADSTFLNGGGDTIDGAFIGIGPMDAFGNTANVQMGKNNSTTGANQDVEVADDGFFYFGEFADGSISAYNYLDAAMSLSILNPSNIGLSQNYAVPGGLVTMAAGGFTNQEQTSSGAAESTETLAGATWTWETASSCAECGGVKNLAHMDSGVNAHLTRLSVDGDLLQGVPEGSQGIVLCSCLNASNIIVRGGAQALTVTFTTGTISTVPAEDSTTAMIAVTWNNNSASNLDYIVTPFAGNSAAGITLSQIKPWIKNIGVNQFALMASAPAWNNLTNFSSNTPYTFTFVTVDN